MEYIPGPQVLLRTTDGGLTWQKTQTIGRVVSGLGVLGDGSVATIDMNTAGGDSSPVIRSTDAGATFQRISTKPAPGGIPYRTVLGSYSAALWPKSTPYGEVVSADGIHFVLVPPLPAGAIVPNRIIVTGGNG